jgi:hypothetical protein
MSLDFIAEVWEALRYHIDPNDRKDAADTLVNLLIEHNHDAVDIKDAFRGDKAIGKALTYYAEQHDIEEDSEYNEDDPDDNYDD